LKYFVFWSKDKSENVKKISLSNVFVALQVFLQTRTGEYDQFIWDTVAEGHWFGRESFPADEPECGLDGSREACRSFGN
jgi:hypothetical protein